MGGWDSKPSESKAKDGKQASACECIHSQCPVPLGTGSLPLSENIASLLFHFTQPKKGCYNYFILKHYRFFYCSDFYWLCFSQYISHLKQCFNITLFGVIHAMIDAYCCSIFRFWNNVLVLL